jgi:hypothetical protein
MNGRLGVPDECGILQYRLLRHLRFLPETPFSSTMLLLIEGLPSLENSRQP